MTTAKAGYHKRWERRGKEVTRGLGLLATLLLPRYQREGRMPTAKASPTGKAEDVKPKKEKEVKRIKVVSLVPGERVQVASGAVILPASTVQGSVLPAIDWKTAANVVRVRESTASAVKRIDKVLKEAGENEPLRNGVGSKGGHIARQVGAPGPHNGHNPIKDTDRFQTESKLTDEELQKVLKVGVRPFQPPEWDKNHVEAKLLSYKFEPPHVVHDPLFKEEIQHFKSPDRALVLSSRLAFFYQNGAMPEGSLSTVGETGETSVAVGSPPGSASPSRRDLAPLPAPTSSLSVSLAPSSSSSSAGAAGASDRALAVSEQWKASVEQLRSVAVNGISYKDLTEISAMREPPAFVESLCGYVALLLGLQPSWKACKRSLFSELHALEIFLKQVEPLTIPVKRLRKATALKRSRMPDLTLAISESVCRSRCFASLAMWVGHFNALAELAVGVLDKAGGRPVGPARGGAASSVDGGGSIDLPSLDGLGLGSLGFEDSVVEVAADLDDLGSSSSVRLGDASMSLSPSHAPASPSTPAGASPNKAGKAKRRRFGTIPKKQEASQPKPRSQGSAITSDVDFIAFFESLGGDEALLEALVPTGATGLLALSSGLGVGGLGADKSSSTRSATAGGERPSTRAKTRDVAGDWRIALEADASLGLEQSLSLIHI